MSALSIASAVLAGIVVGTSILSEPPLERSFRIYIGAIAVIFLLVAVLSPPRLPK